MPARSPSFSAHSGESVPADPVAGRIDAAEFRANAGEQRIDGGQELFRRKPAELLVPHPFVAHGADAARNRRGVGDAAQNRRHHIAVLERGGHAVALRRDCGAASAAASPSPIRTSRRRRTTGWHRGRRARAGSVICAASSQARWSHQR